MENLFKQDPTFTIEVLSRFIKSEVEKYTFQGGVVALSGGLDSAFTAILAHKALDGRVKLLYMPYENPPQTEQDALSVASLLGLPLEKIDLKPIAEPFFNMRNPLSNLRKGNILARLRMTALFDISARDKSLVIGTSNKSEILVGYSTWYGDSAAGIMPLGDLYKTQIRMLSPTLCIPESILKKTPSAELWEGQSDEEEIGISYEKLDQILFLYIDQRHRVNEIMNMGFSEQDVQKVVCLTKKALYKQRTAIICKVSDRTVGIDYRYVKEASMIEE